MQAFFRECLRPGQRVLELGSGSGASVSAISSKIGARAIGIDLSSTAARLARARHGGDFLAMDAFRLGFKDASFDAVYSVGVYEHFRPSEVMGLARESARVVKPSGLMMIDVPYTFNLYTVYKRARMLINDWPPGWEREFTRRELADVLREVGFEVESARTHGPFLHPHFRPLVRKRLRPLAGLYDAVGRVAPSPRNQFITVVARKRARPGL